MIIAWKISKLFEGLNFDGVWVLFLGGLSYNKRAGVEFEK